MADFSGRCCESLGFCITLVDFVVWPCSALHWDFCFVVPPSKPFWTNKSLPWSSCLQWKDLTYCIARLFLFLFFQCSWNTKGIMVLAWMLRSAHAFRTGTELWFWHGCSGGPTQFEHEGYYGLCMDALVSVCSWNRNGTLRRAWMLWRSYAIPTRPLLWFGHGCSKATAATQPM